MATNMTNQFVYIVGPPGVGKYTAASILAARMPAKLVDNHYYCEPVESFGKPEMFAYMRQHKLAVVATICADGPRGDATEDSDYDIAIFLRNISDRMAESDRIAIAAMPFPAGSHRERTLLTHEIRREGLDLPPVINPSSEAGTVVKGYDERRT